MLRDFDRMLVADPDRFTGALSDPNRPLESEDHAGMEPAFPLSSVPGSGVFGPPNRNLMPSDDVGAGEAASAAGVCGCCWLSLTRSGFTSPAVRGATAPSTDLTTLRPVGSRPRARSAPLGPESQVAWNQLSVSSSIALPRALARDASSAPRTASPYRMGPWSLDCG